MADSWRKKANIIIGTWIKCFSNIWDFIPIWAVHGQVIGQVIGQVNTTPYYRRKNILEKLIDGKSNVKETLKEQSDSMNAIDYQFLFGEHFENDNRLLKPTISSTPFKEGPWHVSKGVGGNYLPQERFNKEERVTPFV